MKKYLKPILIALISSILTTIIILNILIIGLGLNDKNFPSFLRFLITYRYVNTFYVDKDNLDYDKLIDGAVNGMLQNLDDPHSIYLDPQMLNQLQSQMSASFTGIGVIISKDSQNQPRIIEVLPNSPSANAGIKAGDIILEIDGESTQNMNYELVPTKIRGEEGTIVKLTIKRHDQRLSFDIKREKIHIPTVSGKLLGNHLGYIHISSFSEDTSEQFASELAKLQAEHIQGLIIDVRNNPGGLLDTSVDIAKQLVPAGPIAYVDYGDGHKDSYSGEGPGFDLPIVVLINGYSASASELLASALRDRNKAYLIGTQSYGKGSVQSVMPLNEASALKLTIAKYYTDSKVEINKQGLKPDLNIELPENTVIDTQLQAAIKYLSNMQQK